MWEPMLGTGPDREARMAAFVADTPLRRFGGTSSTKCSRLKAQIASKGAPATCSAASA